MNREKKIVQTSLVGVGANVLLVGFKILVGVLAGSISIIMDAINNLTDALSSVITIIGTKLSGKRPTKKHPFGYGRIEYITATIIAALIIFAGGSAIYESIKIMIENFRTPSVPTYEWYSFVIIGSAIIVKVGLGLFFRFRGRKLDSDALVSSGTDALFDALLSLATLIGAIVALTANVNIEPYLGILIGLFILKSGISALGEGLSDLIGVRMDTEQALQMKKHIRDTFPVVRGVYDLIVNTYGPNSSIGSFHVEIPNTMTADEIQLLERQIAEDIFRTYHMVATIGIYAYDDTCEMGKRVREIVREIARKEPNLIQIHGLYLDEANKKGYFDYIVNYKEEHPEDIRDHLVDALKKNIRIIRSL